MWARSTTADGAGRIATATLRGAFVLAVALSSATRADAKVDETAILWAIGEVESGHDPRAIGKFAGERSEWQMMPYTWALYTTEPFDRATTDREFARAIARQHLQAIVRRLERRRQPVTARSIAQAWNPGAPGDYAQRVVNLYIDRRRVSAR